MKLRLVEFLRCPLSGGRLRLVPFEVTQHPLTPTDRAEAVSRHIDCATLEQAVKTGVLLSDQAGVWYPIVNYVPVMLDFKTKLHDWFRSTYRDKLSAHVDYQPPTGAPRPGELLTQRSFSTQWNILQDDELSFSYTHQEREDFLRLELDWPSWVLARNPGRLLDVGCGFGMEALSLRNVTGAEVFGTDLNLSLLTSGPKFPKQPFVHTVIASLFALPYAKKSFDIVYSHGVLHHTYSTRSAFESVYSHMTARGMIYIWLYGQEDFAKNLTLSTSHMFETLFRASISRLPRLLQSFVVWLFAVVYHRHQSRYGINRDKWKFKNSLHMVRDRWTCRYAHRHSFHEVMCWFLDKGLDYELVNSLAYRQRFDYSLIGIGIRGTRSHAPGEVEDRGMKMLILTHDHVESLDRRIVNESRILTEHGWKVHIVLTSQAERARAHELEKGIVVDPIPLRQIETVFDPLFHDPVFYETRVAEMRDVVAKRFPKDSGMYRTLRTAFRAVRRAESWLPQNWPDPERERVLSDVMEKQLTQTPRPRPRALLKQWIRCQTPPPYRAPMYLRLYRWLRQGYLAVKSVGQALRRLTSRATAAPSAAPGPVTEAAAEAGTGAPGNAGMCYPMPFTLSFVKKARGLQADAIMACDLPALPAALQLSLAWKVPLIYDSHELYTEQNCFTDKQRHVLEHHERQALKHAEVCFVVSDQISREMQEKYQLPQPPVVLYNAPKFNYDAAKVDSAGVRRELGLGEQQKYLLYHGGIVRGRNLERVVSSFCALAPADTVLVLLGYGPAYDDFARLASRSDGKVLLHAAVPQDALVPWVKGAEACIIPYLATEKNNEFALPNKLFDCLELSTPIIANHHLVCIKQIVQEQQVGWVGPMETDDEMRQTLAAGLDWLRLNKVGKDAAFKRARARYGWDAHRTTFCRSLRDVGLAGF